MDYEKAKKHVGGDVRETEAFFELANVAFESMSDFAIVEFTAPPQFSALNADVRVRFEIPAPPNHELTLDEVVDLGWYSLRRYLRHWSDDAKQQEMDA